MVSRRGGGTVAKAGVAALLVVGTVAAPLVALLANPGPRSSVSAQSEVIVIEQAALTFGHGRNPYRALDRSPEFDRLEQITQDHFPYLPLMTTLGVGRLLTTSAWGDLRVVVGLGWLLIAAALAWRKQSARSRFCVLLAAAGPVALFATTGGDDLVVVAAVLAGMAAAHSRSWVRAGLVLGVSLALKQTAWPVVAVSLLWLWKAHGWRVAAKVGSIATALATAVVAPFLVWDFRAAWDDLVTFPLHGSHREVVNSPTVGGLIAKALGLDESTLSRFMMVAIVVAIAVVMTRVSLPTVWHGASVGAAALGAIVLLSPGVRPGLLIYPVVIVTWAVFEIREEKATSTPPKRGALGGPGRI